jgi:hypothetical protein
MQSESGASERCRFRVPRGAERSPTPVLVLGDHHMPMAGLHVARRQITRQHGQLNLRRE